MSRSDPSHQFSLLVDSSESLKGEYRRDDASWKGSPFEWMISLPSRTKGAFAEALVSSWLTKNGFAIQRSPDAEADRVVDGVRVEIKSSTLWSGQSYVFQQLRDQDYRVAICLGISPSEAHCWVIPKATILEGWGSYEGLVSQHGGKAGTDTAWLQVDPHASPDWLAPHGGSLEEGLAQLKGILAELRPSS